MTLPTRATKQDIIVMSDYLRRYPRGATVNSAKDALGSSLLHPTRIEAYVSWGFVRQDGDTLALTELGRNLAQSSEAEQSAVFQTVIRQYDVYVKTLEYLFYQKRDHITIDDLSSYWAERYGDEVSQNTQVLKSQVVCFARLVKEAGLGQYSTGRGSKTTIAKLDVTREAIGSYLTPGDQQVVPEVQTDPETLPDTPVTTPLKQKAAATLPMVVEQPLANDRLGFSPKVHIDIQIHIQPDADSGQIEDIFKNMAKYLYGRDVD